MKARDKIFDRSYFDYKKNNPGANELFFTVRV
jgi:hypothetical protein